MAAEQLTRIALAADRRKVRSDTSPRLPRYVSCWQQTVLHASADMRRREVGATLHVVTADGEPASHNSALQWLRQVAGVMELEVIAGAVRCQARLLSGQACPMCDHSRVLHGCNRSGISAFSVGDLA